MLITPIFIIKLLLSNWNILRLIAVQLEETVVIPKGIFTLIKKTAPKLAQKFNNYYGVIIWENRTIFYYIRKCKQPKLGLKGLFGRFLLLS